MSMSASQHQCTSDGIGLKYCTAPNLHLLNDLFKIGSHLTPQFPWGVKQFWGGVWQHLAAVLSVICGGGLGAPVCLDWGDCCCQLPHPCLQPCCSLLLSPGVPGGLWNHHGPDPNTCLWFFIQLSPKELISLTHHAWFPWCSELIETCMWLPYHVINERFLLITRQTYIPRVHL